MWYKGSNLGWAHASLAPSPTLQTLLQSSVLVLQVFVDPLTVIDMEFIASTLFPAIDKNTIKKMVAFNNQVST